MPEYFVCEPGPMGGCLIVWVGATLDEAKQYVARRQAIKQIAKPGHQYFIYRQVTE